MIPSKLKKLIEDALESVHRHPQHDLNLGYRQAIWAALETYNNDYSQDNHLGHNRRAFLANLTVRHVLHIWHQMFPEDNTPQKILLEAEQVMAGTISKEVAKKDSERFWQEMQQLGYSDSKMAFTVGCAAAQALNTAIEDENFNSGNIDYNLTDNWDTEGNDASFFAACAYTNGSVWKTNWGNSQSKKRLQFWEWWLTQAVPMAWEAFANEKRFVNLLDVSELE